MNEVNKGKQIETLQMLRSIAAIIVILSHFLCVETGFEKVIGGSIAVAFFFMICGFLLHYTNKGKIVSAKEFFGKKLIRFVPLYWLTTLGVYLLGMIRPELLNSGQPKIEYLLKAMFFVPYLTNDNRIYPMNPPAWTLFIEIFIYIIYFISMCISEKMVEKNAISRENYAKLCSIISSSIIAVCIIIGLFTDNKLILMYCDIKYMIYFIAGLLMAILYTEKPQLILKTKLNSAVVVISGILLGAFLLFLSTSYDANLFYVSVCILLFFLLLFVFSQQKYPKWMLFVGKISYSSYITHFFVAKFYTRVVVKNFSELLVWQQFVHTLVYLIFSIIVAIVCYYIFEKWLYGKLIKVISTSENK